MRISADRERCVGSGMCALIAPDIFDQDDDGTVLLLDPQPQQQHSAVREALDSCPARALEFD
ncbi:ferredoxin [Nocardia sp. NPDC051321]|uniref:ferredoxin n=1 Tax=Nocardia sp. NPDC051321 TaxID=3364323 RepID=UPI003795DEA1